MLRDFWYEVQKKAKKIYKRKRASRLEWHGILEGFQTDVRLKGYMGGIHSEHDVRMFHVIITVRCRKLELACSRFHNHAHRQLCFVNFA